MTATLEEDKTELVLKEEEIKIKNSNLSLAEQELLSKSSRRKKIQEEKEEFSKKIEERRKLQQEIEKTKIMVVNKKDSVAENKKSISQIEEQVNKLKGLKFDESEVSRIEIELKSLKKERDTFNEENLKINSEISSFSLKNEDAEKLKSRLSKLDSCPTCLQDVTPVYRANVFNKLDSDLVENTKKIKELNEQKIKISEKIRKTEQNISSNQEKIQELIILKIRLEEVREKQKRIEELKNLSISLDKDIELLNNHTELLKASVLELNKYDNIFDLKQKELDESLREERLSDIKVAELKKEIEFLHSQINSSKEKIKKIEGIKKQLAYLTELEDWLSNKFSHIVSMIERNVMIKLKAQFSKLFSEWFSMLVSDNFNVRLGDDFTPIIEQQDYEIEYEYLSGGERTAIALAYRLSLNQVINSFLSKIKTKDLVILDEPTDGFSEQQLDKMRDVLQQLNVRQLIIVSHEQKIEGFVDNVIRLKKEQGLSRKE
jgi:DNA repair protein SbcC/Rad50